MKVDIKAALKSTRVVVYISTVDIPLGGENLGIRCMSFDGSRFKAFDEFEMKYYIINVLIVICF